MIQLILIVWLIKIKPGILSCDIFKSDGLTWELGTSSRPLES